MTEYFVPSTVEEALDLLTAHEGRARIIAGGTDVLIDMEKGKHRSAFLVDITRIPELNRIDVDHDWVTVGAAVPFFALREHPYFAGRVHALVDAAGSVGSLAIQTTATWVGNLVQAMPAADGAIIAIALDADVQVMGASGACWRRVASLYAGPGRSRIDSTEQLVTFLRFPLPRQKWGTGWQRAGRRPSMVLPTLNCATKIVLDGDLIASAAIAMGPVGPCPIRAGEAEAFLVGRLPTQSALAQAARLALCDADPRSSVLRASREYRLVVLPVLVEDALALAARRAQEDPVHKTVATSLNTKALRHQED